MHKKRCKKKLISLQFNFCEIISYLFVHKMKNFRQKKALNSGEGVDLYEGP